MKSNTIILTLIFVILVFNDCFSQNYFKRGKKDYKNQDFKAAIVDFEKYIDENKESNGLIVSTKVDHAYQLAGASSLYTCDFEKSKNYFSVLLERADYSDQLKYSANYNLGFIAYT